MPTENRITLPDNLLSHRRTWIQALERLVELEPETSMPDVDEKGFWQHELKAMHDMYADLDRMKVVNAHDLVSTEIAG